MRRIAFAILLVVVFAIACVQVPLERLSLPASFGSVNRAMGFVLVYIWLITVIVRRGMRKLHMFHYVALLFLTWNGLSLLWVADYELGTIRILRYFEAIGLTFVLWDLLRVPEDTTAVLQAYVFGGIVSIGAIFLDYSTGAISDFSATGRGSSFGFNPNDLACQLAMIIPIAFHLFVAGNRQFLFIRVVNGVFPIAGAAAILLTGSRAAMVAGLVAFVAVTVSMRRIHIGWKAAFLLAVVFGGVLINRMDLETPIERFETIGSSAEKDKFSGRLILWEAGWEAFQKKPVIGIGVGQFEVSAPIVGRKSDIAHNSYLSVLTELGLVGFGCFAAILLVVGRSAFKDARSRSTVWLQSFLVWSIAAFTLTWEHVPQTWLLFGLILAGSHVRRRLVISNKTSARFGGANVHSVNNPS
jgi:O-antigen ligase